jgi:transposase-like protein
MLNWKELEMFLIGAVGTAILAFVINWISKQFFSKTDKKKCPKCSSENVKYLGVARMKRIHKDKKLLPVMHYAFECNKCKKRFDYYGEL